MYYLFIYVCLQLTPRITAALKNQQFPPLKSMHHPHFREPQCSSRFLSQQTTYADLEPNEPSPRIPTKFLSHWFYKLYLYATAHFLSDIRTKATGHNSFHNKTFHMHCQSLFSGCCYVPSSVSVSLETVASIPVVLGAGNLLEILLLVIERCVSGERYNQILATCTIPIANIIIKKFI